MIASYYQNSYQIPMTVIKKNILEGKTFFFNIVYHYFSYDFDKCIICPLKNHSFLIRQKIHYVMKFVSDSQQVSGFLWVLWFPPRYN